MPLSKPPIVEMWIEFNFDPNPVGGHQAAVQFLQEYAEEYPQLEISREDRLEFRQVSPTKLPEVVSQEIAIKHLRAHDVQGTRWLHLTPKQLVCNFLRLGENYPGFEALCSAAVAKLVKYVEICKPVKIRYAAIHYVDVIDVPAPPGGEIKLRDYFTLGLDLPAEPFGSQLSYLIQTTVRPPDGTGPLEIHLQYDPLTTEKGFFRFRMDWHKSRPYDVEVDLGKIPVELKVAHQSVMRCFRAAFTDRTWELFGPGQQ